MNKQTYSIDINAHIANISCEISNSENGTVAIISFDNLGYGNITAVKFNATGYNAFGDIIRVNGKEQFFLIIQDINIAKNESAKGLKAKMPNNDIRSLTLEECQICFSDGTVSTYLGNDTRQFSLTERSVSEAAVECMALKAKFGKEFTYIPLKLDFGWVCGCGRYNPVNNVTCSKCCNKKEEVLAVLDDNEVMKIVSDFQKSEELRKEQERLAEIQKEKERKKRNIIISISIIISAMLAWIIGNALVMAGRSTYSSEAEMKAALQGTYTYYNDSGKASRQMVISGDTVTYKWSHAGDMETDIREWNYEKGIIHTFEDIIVTSDGNLKSDGELYKKGGSMSSGNSYTSSYESAYTALKISAGSVSSNSSYTTCNASVTNNGNKTYKFVEVKGSFKDSKGNVVDTDWTYAVGSEGLAPGETTKFSLSVSKDYSIESCSISIIDYD